LLKIQNNGGTMGNIGEKICIGKKEGYCIGQGKTLFNMTGVRQGVIFGNQFRLVDPCGLARVKVKKMKEGVCGTLLIRTGEFYVSGLPMEREGLYYIVPAEVFYFCKERKDLFLTVDLPFLLGK